jgi:hypothetical protein
MMLGYIERHAKPVRRVLHATHRLPAIAVLWAAIAARPANDA